MHFILNLLILMNSNKLKPFIWIYECLNDAFIKDFNVFYEILFEILNKLNN